MEKSGTPITAGISGAVLMALLAAPFTAGRLNAPAEPNAQSSTKVGPTGDGAVGGHAADTPNFNTDGPWYAICREYLTQEPPEETQPEAHEARNPPGVFVHVDPPHANDNMSELFEAPKGTNREQKYKVTTHYSANLSDCTAKSKTAVTVLVATVPDPLATHMQLVADREIDAIGQGAAVEGYSLTSYWLPWRTGDVRNAETSSEAALSRRQEPGVLIYRKPEHDKDGASRIRLLFVMLVGETPTGGVNRLQMARALRDAKEMAVSDPRRDGSAEPLLILGPNFSGSFDSMKQELEASPWICRGLQKGCVIQQPLVIISPGASVQEAIERFRSSFGAPCSNTLSLVSLELSGDPLEQIAKRELTHRFGIAEEQIAWLSEDESVFGSSNAHDSPISPEPNDAGGKNGCRQDQTSHGKPEMESLDKLSGALHLQYPRDLSSLRNTTDPGALLITPADLTGDAQSSQHGVELKLGDNSTGNLDSPPAFAAAQEAARAEAALDGIVERIHERRIQAAVVTASNPLDQLFLLDYLHRNVPNVRLVTMGADEFMVRRPSRLSLVGTLVLGGLPLLPGEETNRSPNPKPCAPTKDDPVCNVHMGFPSSGAVGQFLATRLLLLPDAQRTEAIRGLIPKASESSARGQNEAWNKPGRETGPPGLPIEDVGTFIVGRYGLEPLEGSNLFTHYPIGEPAVYVRATVNPYPTSWLFLMGFVALLTVWHLLAVYLPGRTVNRTAENGGPGTGSATTINDKRSSEKQWRHALRTAWHFLVERLPAQKESVAKKWAYPPRPDISAAPGAPDREHWASLQAYRNYYVYVACNQVTLLQIAVCSVTAVLLWHFRIRPFNFADRINSPVQFSWGSLCWAWGLFVVNLLLFVGALRESLRRGVVLMRASGAPKTTVGRAVVIETQVYPILSVAAWLAVLVPQHWRFADGYAAIAIRCASLAHGLSPFVPFATLLLAYLLWALVNLQRIGDACSRRVWIEPGTPAEGSFGENGALTKLLANLHHALQNRARDDDDLQKLLSIAWIFSLILAGVWNATRGIDGTFFHCWILLYGMLVLLYLCALEVLFAFRRWAALKALLNFLERSPIAMEFSAERMSTELASMRIWQMGSMHNDLLIQSHITDMLEEPDRSDAERHLCKWLNDEQEGLHAKASTSYALSLALNGRLESYARILDQPRDRAGGPLWCIHARYLALRFTALIPYALQQIRTTVSYVVWGFAAAVLCVASYPFQGAHALAGFISIACVVMLGAICLLLIQIERHPLLSRLEGTDAGKASFLQVAGRLLSIGGLPLIAVLASQFPAMGDFLVSWVKPVIGGH